MEVVMKTITVSNEMYEFLMSLSEKLNSQDNRATATPYFFQIRTRERIAVPDGCGIEAWWNDDVLIETKEEIQEVVNEYKGWDAHTTEFNHLDDYDIEDILEKAGYKKVNYDYEYKYQNAFLTEDACKAHIKSNMHHYNEPVDYLSYAFRNPELEGVLKFLSELSDGKIHK